MIVPDLSDAVAQRSFRSQFRERCGREVEIRVETRNSASPRGAFLAQDPAEGARLSCLAAQVTVTLSSGTPPRIERLPQDLRQPDLRATPVEPVAPEPPAPLVVPDLSDAVARRRFAREVMVRCNRPLELDEERVSNEAPQGDLLAQRPPPGVVLSCRAPRVVLLVSAGLAQPEPEPERLPPRPQPEQAPEPPPPQPEPAPEPPPPQPEPRPAPVPQPEPAPAPVPPPIQPRPMEPATPQPVPVQPVAPQPVPPDPLPAAPDLAEPLPVETRAVEPRPSPPPPPGEADPGLPWGWIAGGALLVAGGGYLAGRLGRRPPARAAMQAGIARGTGKVAAELSGPLTPAGPIIGLRWRMPPPVATLVHPGVDDG